MCRSSFHVFEVLSAAHSRLFAGARASSPQEIEAIYHNLNKIQYKGKYKPGEGNQSRKTGYESKPKKNENRKTVNKQVKKNTRLKNKAPEDGEQKSKEQNKDKTS